MVARFFPEEDDDLVNDCQAAGKSCRTLKIRVTGLVYFSRFGEPIFCCLCECAGYCGFESDFFASGLER